jgi:hypothetical protein
MRRLHLVDEIMGLSEVAIRAYADQEIAEADDGLKCLIDVMGEIVSDSRELGRTECISLMYYVLSSSPEEFEIELGEGPTFQDLALMLSAALYRLAEDVEVDRLLEILDRDGDAGHRD